MAATAEAVREYTNPQSYFEVDADKIRPQGDRILLQWQEAKDTIGKRLLRPENFKKAHYTGVVLAVPVDGDGQSRVDGRIKVGVRIVFEQFSGFQKWFDPKYGRLALIRESDAIAIVPARTQVSSMDGDYDFDQ